MTSQIARALLRSRRRPFAGILTEHFCNSGMLLQYPCGAPAAIAGPFQSKCWSSSSALPASQHALHRCKTDHSIHSPQNRQQARHMAARSSKPLLAIQLLTWHQRRGHAQSISRRHISASAAAEAAAPSQDDDPAEHVQPIDAGKAARSVMKFIRDQFLPLGLLASMALG